MLNLLWVSALGSYLLIYFEIKFFFYWRPTSFYLVKHIIKVYLNFNHLIEQDIINVYFV